jgi:acetoin utilization protein AcuB
MPHLPTLKTLMTPFPYAIDIDAGLSEAQRMMAAHTMHHLPVTEHSALVGVLTAHDIQRYLNKLHGIKAPEALRVRDVYVHEAYVVDLEERLDTVLLHMAAQHIGSTLVVRYGKLVGIFTTTDACQGFGEYVRDQLAPDPGDEAA